MAKRPGFRPFILMDGYEEPGDGNLTGGGTAQAGHGGAGGAAGGNGVPITYEQFRAIYPMDELDVIGGDSGIEEFAQWWLAQGFDPSSFAEYSGVEWNPAWNK